MSQDPRGKLSNVGRDFVHQIRHDTYPFIDPTKQDLSGRHVLITGASRGIGKQIAVAYALAGAAAIVMTARSDLSSQAQEVAQAAVQAGHSAPQIITLKLDVASRESVAAAAKEVQAQLGHVDIVVCNSGVLETWVPMTEQDPDVWWNTWETNVKGTYLTLHSFIPLLLASPKKDRTIVILSSTGALAMLPGASAYQSSKFALLRLTEFVNFEYGGQGILAYGVHPGGVATEMGHSMGPKYKSFLVDTPELSANSIVWLTGERREWLAGRYASCTWDMEELLKKKDEIVAGELLKARMAVE